MNTSPAKTILALAKDAALIFIYTFIMGLLAMFVTMVKSFGLQVLLYILVLAFFMMIIILFTRTTGEKQYKNLINGNIRRSHGVEEDIKKYCRPHEEYKLYKGFLIAVIAFLPLFILLVLSLFIDANAIQLLIKLGYSIFFAPLSIFGPNTSVFFTLVPCALCVGCSGFGYWFGAKRIMHQQDKLQKTHELIYGKEEK